MNRDEYEELRGVGAPEPMISVEELDGPDRTLLYGYDVSRNTYHAHLQHGEIHLVVELGYQGRKIHTSGTTRALGDLVPNKRAYPAKTDYQFARLCAVRGVDITFTTFEDVPADQVRAFYGPVA
jgi:hypothetical protein